MKKESSSLKVSSPQTVKVLHREAGRSREARDRLSKPLGAHRVETQGVVTEEEERAEFLTKHLARKLPITEDERVKRSEYTESLSQKGVKSFKIHNAEKNITFIREAGTRVQLKSARQSFLLG